MQVLRIGGGGNNLVWNYTNISTGQKDWSGKTLGDASSDGHRPCSAVFRFQVVCCQFRVATWYVAFYGMTGTFVPTRGNPVQRTSAKTRTVDLVCMYVPLGIHT